MCDMPEFAEESVVRAKKPYRCSVCWMMISANAKYVSLAGKWNGEMSRYSFHLGCWDAYRWMRDELKFSDCLAFEETEEALHEAGDFQYLEERPDEEEAA